MPAILERLVSQLKADGKGEQQAYAIATSQLQKHGIIDHHGALTEKGLKRDQLGPSGRAKDRAAKASGGKHKPKEFSYNARTNQATLRKKGRL
jgi:hypothetical protein